MTEYLIDWVVRGSSTVELSDKEIDDAVAVVGEQADDRAIVEEANRQSKGEILYEASRDFDEQDPVELLEAIERFDF